jgi:hypothetical protein
MHSLAVARVERSRYKTVAHVNAGKSGRPVFDGQFPRARRVGVYAWLAQMRFELVAGLHVELAERLA